VVAGDPRITRPLVDALRTPERAVVEDRRSLDGHPVSDLVEMLAARVAEARRRRRLALAETAVSTALAGGQAVLGLGDTLAALAAGRVRHLLLDAGREYEGSRANGMLIPKGELPPGARPADLAVERHLDERMIERALETRARVTLLGRDAVEALSAGDGVAALLRW
jgi:peptide subunit release factor 1 (eRF1)